MHHVLCRWTCPHLPAQAARAACQPDLHYGRTAQVVLPRCSSDRLLVGSHVPYADAKDACS